MASYEKHTWVDDELITDERLNEMEGGIEDAYVFDVSFNATFTTCDRTYEEMYQQIYRRNKPVCARVISGGQTAFTQLQFESFQEDIPEESQPGFATFLTPMVWDSDDGAFWRKRITVHDDNTITTVREPELAI